MEYTFQVFCKECSGAFPALPEDAVGALGGGQQRPLRMPDPKFHAGMGDGTAEMVHPAERHHPTHLHSAQEIGGQADGGDPYRIRHPGQDREPAGGVEEGQGDAAVTDAVLGEMLFTDVELHPDPEIRPEVGTIADELLERAGGPGEPAVCAFHLGHRASPPGRRRFAEEGRGCKEPRKAGRGMSRLDSFIRRLEAQRACLDFACAAIADLPGPVLELGLGNGRTFDHLRERLPGRAIFVFERDPKPHPDCWPDPDRLIVGDLADTLPRAAARLPAPAALVHADLGTGDAAHNARLAAWLSRMLPPLLAAGGLVVADQELGAPTLEPLPPPPPVQPGRYFLYRRRSC